MPLQALSDNYPTIVFLLYGLSALVSAEIAQITAPITELVVNTSIDSTHTILTYTFEEFHQITASIAMICLAFKFASTGISKLMEQIRKNKRLEFEMWDGDDRRK